jgi:adhesin/invasin
MSNIRTTLVSAMLTTTIGLSLNAAADDVTNLINKSIDFGKKTIYKDAPDWLKRTSIEIQFEDDFKPTIELETVQPIMQNSKNDMYFYQINARTRDSKESYNLGVGYRDIITEDVMYGINLFYDYSAENNHKRSSIGLEAISNNLEVRTNIYNAISGKKEVKNNEFEQALDGWDVEIGGSILPRNKNLNVYLSHSKFKAVSVGMNNYEDSRIRMTYPINDNAMLEIGHTMEKEKYSSNDKNRSFAKLKYTFGTKSTGTKQFKETGLHGKLLQPVERQHEIVLEKTFSARITISRGT